MSRDVLLQNSSLVEVRIGTSLAKSVSPASPDEDEPTAVDVPLLSISLPLCWPRQGCSSRCEPRDSVLESENRWGMERTMSLRSSVLSKCFETV